jgi:hypothetical protein
MHFLLGIVVAVLAYWALSSMISDSVKEALKQAREEEEKRVRDAERAARAPLIQAKFAQMAKDGYRWSPGLPEKSLVDRPRRR